MAGLIASSSLGKRKKSNQANKNQAFEIRDSLLPSCGLIPTLQFVTQLFSVKAGMYMLYICQFAIFVCICEVNT